MLLNLPYELAAPSLFARWSEALRARLAARAPVTRLHAMRIESGATREVPLGRVPMTVHCRTGMLWATQDGDPKDVVLQAGQSHRVDGRGTLRLHALSPATLEVQLDPRR